jgi:hypothetical protein
MTADEAERIEAALSRARGHAGALSDITMDIAGRVRDTRDELQLAIEEAEKLKGMLKRSQK